MPAPESTWNKTKYGGITFKSQRQACRYWLTHAHNLSQTAIAKRVGCSAPCVNQVAKEMEREEAEAVRLQVQLSNALAKVPASDINKVTQAFLEREGQLA